MDASKGLVNTVNLLFETTRTILEKSGHEQPKTLAQKTLQQSRELISKARAFHLAPQPSEEAEV